MNLLQNIRLTVLVLSTITLCACTMFENGTQVRRIARDSFPRPEWFYSSEEANTWAKSQLGELRTYVGDSHEEIVRKMRFVQYRAVETRQIKNG